MARSIASAETGIEPALPGIAREEEVGGDGVADSAVASRVASMNSARASPTAVAIARSRSASGEGDVGVAGEGAGDGLVAC